MNKLFQILIFFLGVTAVGCSNLDLDPIQDKHLIENQEMSKAINEDQALLIASKVLNNNQVSSRSVGGTPKVEYVLNYSKGRNATQSSDTLAYIVNYPNQGGFVIVASTRTVYPVLAFSKYGNYEYDNEISNDCFLKNIESYINSSDETMVFDVDESDFDECGEVFPMVETLLSQRAPWDEYVTIEHPGCPVGCVAVATALVMSHSKEKLLYHGSLFRMDLIRKAIKAEQEYVESQENEEPNLINGIGFYEQEYTYEQAVDSMAKLLYWIGKDVDMNYGSSGSGADSSKAYQLCKSLNYTISSNYESFDIEAVTDYLIDDHIVYVRGPEITGKGGHAWVCDGCTYCVELNDPTKYKDIYLHCDWGWGGTCNGYYSGSVFKAGSNTFRPQNYFALKRTSYSFGPIVPNL